MALEPKTIRLTGLGFLLMSYLSFANVSEAAGQASEASTYRRAAASVADEINARFLDNATGMLEWQKTKMLAYYRGRKGAVNNNNTSCSAFDVIEFY